MAKPKAAKPKAAKTPKASKSVVLALITGPRKPAPAPERVAHRRVPVAAMVAPEVTVETKRP